MNVLALPGVGVYLWIESNYQHCISTPGLAGCSDVGIVYLFPPFALAALLSMVAVIIDVIVGLAWLLRRSVAKSGKPASAVFKPMPPTAMRVIALLLVAVITVLIVGKLMYAF